MVAIDLADMKEQELMHLLIANDLGAWAELVKRYGKLVYSISFQVLKNNNDTEDAVQNTFVNLKLYASKFDPSQPLKPWLARIASIEAIRIYNKKKYINKKESVRMDASSKSHQSQRRDASEIIEQKEIEMMVKKAIDTLPDNSRLALTLYYAGGLNQSEIADQLGISQVRISMAIKSGLDKVKTYLKKAGINATIILSPNLMQEGIVSAMPPQTLMQKLIAHLPTDAQLANAASASTQMAIKKGIAWWFWCLLSIPFISFFSYLYWPAQETTKLNLTVERNAQQNNEKNNGFKSVDFNNYEPLYYQWVTQQLDTKPISWKPSFMAFYGGDPKWTVLKSETGENVIRRNPFKSGEVDGVFLKQNFENAYQFNGQIKINSKNSEFGFFTRTPLKEKADVVLEGKKINLPDHGGKLGSFKSDVNCEVIFQIFIWPKSNRWNSLCFFIFKDDISKNKFTTESVEIAAQQFLLGFYASGETEIFNFKYRSLDPDWEPLLEPSIKAISDILPKDFLPKTK